MKRILLFLLMASMSYLGYSQETCETAIDIDPGTFTADVLTGAGASNNCFGTGGTNAAWYSITPEIDGFMTVASCLGGTDTRLSIYDGTCDALNCAANNDDFCEMTAGGLNYASQIIMNVDSGSTYLIEWDDRWSTESFDFSVVITDCLDLVENFSALNNPFGTELSWDGNANGTYTLEYGEAGFTQGEGTILTGSLDEQPVIITDLASETTFDYYVMEVCDGGDSTSVYQSTFTTTPLPPVCGGEFLDTGGSENFYGANEFIQTIICPEIDGEVVTVNFTSFDVQTFEDNLQIFNGPDTDSPSLGTYTGQDNIGAFESTHESGCLTFLFTSGAFGQSAGWSADVTCAPPSACPFPGQLSVSDVNEEGGILSWVSTGEETEWSYEVVLTGEDPTGTGILISENPYTITGLDPDTAYDVYVTAECGDDSSLQVGPASFVTSPAPPECGGVFTDSGGESGNYGNNENITYVVCPDVVGEVVTVVFQDINIESCCDVLNVFDGPDATFPLLFQIAGVNPDIPPITSTHEDGCLTFLFTSDGSVTPSGWIADVICGPPPTCPTPSDINITDVDSDSAIMSWIENGEATSWDIEIVAAGEAPTGTTFTVTENPYTFEDLDADSGYDVYLNANCGVDNLSFILGPNSFITSPLPPACGGTFVDSGGSDGNYSNNENTTTVICPDVDGEVVTVVFQDINIEGCCDVLNVFDGPDATFPLLFQIAGVSPDVPPITSTHESGCLTFIFTSDGSVTPSGWIADVICGPPPTCPTPSEVSIDFITPTTATLNWLENGEAEEWEVEIVLAGEEPTGAGMIVSENPYTMMDLDPDTSFDVYINAYCGEDDESFQLGPFTFTTFPLPPVCDGTFYDLGGEFGNYLPNEFTTTTVCPENDGDAVTVTFTEFNINQFGDTLFVFNGSDINAPSLGSYTGAVIPDAITSADTSGCLTFLFVSTAFGENSGWAADVTCAPPPSCFDPIQLSIDNITDIGGMVSWVETGNATSWNIEVLPTGETPTGLGETITENPYLVETLDSLTTYDLYITSICSDDELSAQLGPLTFTTGAVPPDNNFCDGAIPLGINVDCIITQGTTAGATDSGIIPGCANYQGGDVWYSFVAPGSGEVVIETSGDGGIGDGGLALYSGDCENPTLIQCDDDGGVGLFSLINGTGLTPGETYYAVVWEYGGDVEGTFEICITAEDAGCEEFLDGPILEFNTQFDGAPVSDIEGNCPLNQITDFEVTASEYYSVDGFISGNTYTFSMCEGPGAGSWNPEITLMDTDMNIIQIVQGCELEWLADINGTYLIGINEVGLCGEASPNTEVGNGYPSLTCVGEPACSTFLGGPWTNFNGDFGGAPSADTITGICPVNTITTFAVIASESYIIDNFVEGTEYTFSMCEGVGAGSWEPELMLMDENFTPIMYIQDCELTWTAAFSGTYIIGINEVGFCGTDSQNTTVANGNASLTCADEPVGVEELNNSFNLSLYPNPADEQLTIRFNGTNSEKNTMKIVSLQGKLISEQVLISNSGAHTIDVSSIAPGVYILELSNGNSIATKKVVIE